ncbi:MAG: flagellar basal body-associated FliL family protein [Gammaproteobacteria bacterium]|nr:flagellar basal body-associated FliL family protein [Gammaproteobacteria bacterium]MBU1776262.1 flagellar basal body-associated FliL family protein [Gammaproteobacteria bacterium]MBU1968409.1 flagellar basal body-associated FliL family protein [Gammaproteobacteria bacterium]
MATRPPAKPVAPAAKEEAPVAAPPKSKKKLIIAIIVLLLAAGGGAGWYFTQGKATEDKHAAEMKTEPALEAKFVPMGENFTVNLQREEGDQYLQAGITLKIMQPELEEKIKKTMPEIRSKLLFLLSSKYPSELQTAEGKKKLVSEVIAEVDGVLGLAAPAPAVAAPETGHDPAASGAAPAPVVAAPVEPKTTGVVDVLFTSFIIQ